MESRCNVMTLGDDPRAGESSNDFEREPYEVRHEPASDAPVSNAITQAVATVTETEPETLRPLYEVVEPDALDRLFAPTSATDTETTRDGHVVFPYEGCTVRVTADGRVVITPSEDRRTGP